MRRLLAVLFAAVLVLAVFSAPPAGAAPDVRRMVLNRESVSMPVGGTFILKVDISPFTADRSVTWASSDESVVTVDGGLLTGVAVGSAGVTVTSVQNPSVSLTAQVMVVKPVESITLEDQSIALPKGYTWDAVAYVMPEDATLKRPVWSTSDRKVAVVDEAGVITAVNNGYCVITASAADGLGAKASVRVQVRPHEYVISEPGEFHVGFEMPEDEGTDEVVKGKATVRDDWQLTVVFENGRLEKKTDTSVIPLSAGSEIVHLREIHNHKIIRESRHFIFIEKSALREAGAVPEQGAGGEVLFRDIPWGLRYKDVKALLSSRKEKLKSPVMRNGLLWTQINGEITFGDFRAFSNGLSFSSSSANVQNLTANLQKTSFCMGDYYFDRSIPFENLKQNVMKTYGLPENETTASSEECTWEAGHVTVRLFTTPKCTQLQISYHDPRAEAEAGAGQETELETGDTD